jgi:S1-C subfamily serine protease
MPLFACSIHTSQDEYPTDFEEAKLHRFDKFAELPFGALVGDCASYALLEKKLDRGGAKIDTISPGSVAEASGFRPNDCLILMDETKILNGIHFASVVRDRSGQDVLISYIRTGSLHQVRVELRRVRLK